MTAVTRTSAPEGGRRGPFANDIVIMGGCGRAGLPLGIALADRGLHTIAYDIDHERVRTVNDGVMPFLEPGATEVLRRVLNQRCFSASSDPAVITGAEHLVVTIGTPVDKHLNPDPLAITRALNLASDYLVDGQVVILRSTVHPGVTASVERLIEHQGRSIDVAFCPERIAEGQAMHELLKLPQIVAARTDGASQRAAALFRHLTDEIIFLSPEEAELAKLFTNAWRYIKFATANQMFMFANDFGLDYERIRQAMAHDYPRASDLPRAGFAAGPCLLKDTMQLAAFSNNNFLLGHTAMLVNEGLPLYIVSKLERQFDLANMTVGILGMAFKAGSDDTRSSLSYKLKRCLQFRSREVVCSDPYVTSDPSLVSLEVVLQRADLLIVGAPHRPYTALSTSVPVVDVWNLLGDGVQV